ncbi:TlpA disulfide reductase family protein [Elizabethkingia sp. JS20170427COW]|uniref:TlpA family protein disulfide reductase n=1 Tax=Elizabethkingia sp. JS20170427COW TaxID=2583851 RepID=UPI00143CEB82|nr:TlpA disulfide reductase family protein [Elizabethkingia sp. JS20170427COW]
MKNKKLLGISAILIPVVLIGILIYLYAGLQKKKEKIEALNKIPTFSVQDINGATVTEKNIPEGNKVLVYFNSECGYCQMEMQELSQINEKHQDINWIMFTDKPLKEIQQFAEKYHLDKVKNVKWCNDPKSEVYLKFAMTGIPYFLGYNAENKLVHRSTGATKIEKILTDFDGK